MIDFLSNVSIPILIFVIVISAMYENKKVFDLFIEGVKEGLKISLGLFPTILGIVLAVNMLKDSGTLDILNNFLSPLLYALNIPKQLLPLMAVRPISGSAAISVATSIIKTEGVDSLIGDMAAVIMGATETTLYTIAIYTSSIKTKGSWRILLPSLIADFIGILAAVVFCRILSKSFS